MKEVRFEELLISMGESVQKASKMIERNAVSLYFDDYEPYNDNSYKPKTKSVYLPVSAEKNAQLRNIKVPLTALCNHNSMSLSSINIKLKFIPIIRDTELFLDIKKMEEEGIEKCDYSEMELCFKNESASEGMARVNENSTKIL